MITKDKYGTHPISIKSRDGEINFTIYLTEEQMNNLNKKGIFSISYRKVEKLKERSEDGTPSYNIFPTIAFTPTKGEPRKRLHLGNYLYPNLQSTLTEKIWKEREWEFREENLKIGPTQTVEC